jgi:rhodanese-related sulfurtransferase
MKLERIVAKLTRLYQPFTSLSKERCIEAVNNLRILELRQGDQLRLAAHAGAHCILVIEGKVGIIDHAGTGIVVEPPLTARYPTLLPADAQGVRLTAQQDSTVCYIERQLLDDVLSWGVMTDVIHETDPVLGRQLDQIRNCRVFRRLPFECVEAAFRCMDEVDVPAGHTVVRQGEPADAFYIIKQGTAEVYFKEDFEAEPELIARLKEGDAFGSEVLISGCTRNETVRMSSAGSLMVLSRAAFDRLIRKSFIRTVNCQVAQAMLSTGFRLLDVRSQEEYDEIHIPGACLMPLGELRNRIGELDAGLRYIVYCQAGGRSAIAALVLSEYQFEVYSMEGGIHCWPYAKESLFARPRRQCR